MYFCNTGKQLVTLESKKHQVDQEFGMRVGAALHLPLQLLDERGQQTEDQNAVRQLVVQE